MQASLTQQQVAIQPVVSLSKVVEINLANGELFSLVGDRRGTRLESVGGVFWVTQFDDPADHWLLPGQSLVIDRKGKVVVAGLPGGTLRLA
jgi:hypothetical protein